MKVKIHLTLLFILVIGCKTNQRVNKLKEGRWVYQNIIQNDTFDYIEKYHQGTEVKKWKNYRNKKIYKTEKFKNGICIVTNYYPNGKIMNQGKTKSEIKNHLLHWYYFGNWNYYDKSGKLIEIRKYENGILH